MAPLFPVLLAGVASASADPQSEVPAGQWRVDYGETQCVAMRSYGDRILAFRSAPNGESYEIILIEPGSTGEFAAQTEGSVSFGGEPLRTTVLVYSDRKAKKRFFKYRLMAEDIEQGRAAKRIVLRSRRGDARPVPADTRVVSVARSGSADLTLTDMPAVMAQMEKCTEDLRKYWNDPRHSIVVAVPARGDIGRHFSGDDYPAEAYSRDQGGTTQAILLIDEKGKVASCYNALPSGIATVDAMSCQVIVNRAKFEPARDASGRPVRSIYYSPRITFRMGE